MPLDPDAYPAEPSQVHVPSLNAQQQARMDAAFNEMAAKERHAAESAKQEMDLMTEARTRFAKAALYEQIIEGQLFEGEDPVTLAVEEEFKVFAEERLMCLLGMQAEKTKADPTHGLDEEEVNVLKLFASKLLGRQASIPRPPAAPTPAVVTRPSAPAPVAGTLAAPKRGRGRPPGTGKNQRALTAAAPQEVAYAPRPTSAPVIQDPPAMVDTKKQVTLPSGKVVEVTVQQSDVARQNALTGKPVNAGQAPTMPKPLPMPSPNEMIANAADVGEMGMKGFNHKLRTAE